MHGLHLAYTEFIMLAWIILKKLHGMNIWLKQQFQTVSKKTNAFQQCNAVEQ